MERSGGLYGRPPSVLPQDTMMSFQRSAILADGQSRLLSPFAALRVTADGTGGDYRF